jgi:hypothetical protein
MASSHQNVKMRETNIFLRFSERIFSALSRFNPILQFLPPVADLEGAVMSRIG